ncbi:MAG: transaldolase [Acidobacteriaceae bacterium]
MHPIHLKLFADTADLPSMLRLYRHPLVSGFTTNPSLMRKAGISNYEAFGRMVLEQIPDKPVSFEVLAEDAPEIETQALAIASWGSNVFVKITVTDRHGQSLLPTIQRLADSGVSLNVTALFTLNQLASILPMLNPAQPAILSVFAGRIADTGRDPIPMLRAARAMLYNFPNVELLWASPREVFNLFQAQEAGCHIITMPPELIDKLAHLGKDLDAFTLETIESFYRDAEACAGAFNSSPQSLPQAGLRSRSVPCS